MPEICRFFGIVIRMYFLDHAPPHFHATYGGSEAQVQIQPFSLLSREAAASRLGACRGMGYASPDGAPRELAASSYR